MQTMRTSQPVIVDRLLNAPIESVWRALTSREAMKKWSFDVARFEPKVGFEFEFTGGPKGGVQYLHKCRITEVVPLKRLVYSWRFEGSEGSSVVSFDLSAEENGTRIRLTHAGLGTFPAIPDFAKENFVKGWTQMVDQSLRQFVEPIR